MGEETIDARDYDVEIDNNENEALRKRIAELEDRLADLEHTSEGGESLVKAPLDLRDKIKPLISIVLLILLAVIPSALVFYDRWLGRMKISSWMDEAWRWSSFAARSGLPAYFVLAIPCSLVLLFLVMVWRNDSPPETQSFAPTGEVDSRNIISSEQLQRSKIMFILGALMYLAGLSLSWKLNPLASFGTLIGIIFFIVGWLLREIPWESFSRFLKQNGDWILSFVFFHLASILFLADIARDSPARWIYAIMLGLSIVNIWRYIRRIPAILWIFSLAVTLFVWNINDWSFAVIGDDFGFYMLAQDIDQLFSTSEVIARLFSAEGVYGSHPFFSSVIQAVTMKIFGTDSFGWRFSSLYLSAISILFFYYFFRTFQTRRTALLAMALLATSSYIMTFGKVGYNNLQALFAMSLGLACGAWVIKSKRNMAFAALGGALAFCLYVYPAALYAIPLPIVLLLFYAPPRKRSDFVQWGIMVLSFGLIALPLLLQPIYLSSKLPGLFINNPEIYEEDGGLITHFLANFLDAFYSFIYIPQETHFVVVSYVDPLSGAFALLGLAFAIKWSRKNRFFTFIIFCFLILLILVGATHDRRYPPTTRMFMLLPWLAYFAAIGLEWAIDHILALEIINWSKASFFALVIACVIGLNVYQAYSISKIRSTGSQSPEVMFVRLMQKLRKIDAQTAVPKTFLFLTEKSWGIEGYFWLLKAYEIPTWRVQMVRLPLQAPILPESSRDLMLDRNTFIIIQPDMDSEWEERLAAQLDKLGKKSCEIREYTNRNLRFVLWYSPDFEELCVPGP
jgi:hypothetical protein